MTLQEFRDATAHLSGDTRIMTPDMLETFLDWSTDSSAKVVLVITDVEPKRQIVEPDSAHYFAYVDSADDWGI